MFQTKTTNTKQRPANKIKIMAFGTFDIFHRGHESFLKQARELGDCLIVIVARDKTVEKIKGRLSQDNERARLQIIKKSDLADKTVLGSLTDKYAAIKKYRPAIICLGYDQKVDLEELKEKLIEFNLFETKLIKLDSFHPEKYKSSKLRKLIRH